ncbi:MAG: LysR family transcriptional regulator [Chloroflexota bacterium]
MIALEHLHVIDVIYQEGSFRRASERLFKARSAVSYSVKQVEEYYQITIFDRDPYRPELTREGRLLIHKIQHLMQVAHEFDEFARQMSTEVETELRIGVSSIFPMTRVIALLQKLKQDFPTTVVHLDIETSSGERMLLDGKVDIGIYPGMEQDSKVTYKRIEQFMLPVLVSNQFPVPASDLTLTELAQYPQVVLKASYKEGPEVGILKNGLQWYVSDHNTKKELIRTGLGWGRLPLHEIADELEAGTLCKVESCEQMDVPVYIARLKETILGPVGMAVWNFFDQIEGGDS